MGPDGDSRASKGRFITHLPTYYEYSTGTTSLDVDGVGLPIN